MPGASSPASYGGGALAVQYLPAVNRDVDTPPLVLMHGGGPGCHAAADFSALLPLLAARDIYLVDLPGYGDASLRDAAGPRFTGYVHLLTEALDALGITRCDIATQSLGGIAAIVFSATHPGRVHRLVAIGCQPVPPPHGVRTVPDLGARARREYYRDPTIDNLRRTIVGKLEWKVPQRIPDGLLEARHAASVTERALAVAADPSLLGGAEDLAWTLPRVDARTLILWGEHDPFGEPAYGDWLAGRLARGSCAVIADTAHHPQSERPAEVAQLINEHLT